ncbi:hypothetical protein Rhe02_74650 [Rhizocola hellebori]|uniref:Uncharacterized protein n=1 Tax=Rhizocola hellebori TaxID=1392758 RepID=A0A8J3QH95_9ACTN|nr:hypothetical protein [Rhizocola hellebori]GIH09398.1 hypothetical protein Rhe02_74650 [Rhizocola hellebori]
MALAEVTRPAVEAAIEEFDRLGRDAFLATHNFGKAKRYFLIIGDRRYDSKAIMGYAHGVFPGPQLAASDLVGGENTVARHLKRLGFAVEAQYDEAASWDLEPGAELLRQELHDQYGGPQQGGIAPSSRTPNILLFSTKSGQQFGYADQEGWLDSTTYLYTGEGQTGDQKFVAGRGNAAIRDHLVSGRSLRLFEEASRTKTSAIVVRYVGEFVLDEAQPYVKRDAPDGLIDEMRSVIVFRLRPIEVAPHPVLPEAPKTTEVIKLSVESHNTETFTTNPSKGLTEAERREAALVGRFSSWLVKQGHEVGRQQIRLPGGAASLYTDLFDFTTSELFEAKGASTRNHVRLAIGQLFDYERYVKAARRSVLLPVRPQLDLVSLLNDLKIDCVWETEKGDFHRAPAPE